MGECLITRRGGEKYELPVLNEAYPQNVSLIQSASGSATFMVVIDTPGKPAEYTYQWYVNGSKVSGATGISYTKTGLTSVATYTVYCEVTNKAGTVTSRVATLKVLSSMPTYTYSGTHQLINDGNNNWRIKLKSSGVLRFSNLGNGEGNIEVFLVGGGGGATGSGGAGGFTTTSAATVQVNTDYSIVVGAGGAGANGLNKTAGTGGQSSAFNKTANGGGGGKSGTSGAGGNGGSGGGAYGGTQPGGNGGFNGNGATGGYHTPRNGTGQGTTTKEFGESSGDLYAGGGGGAGARYTGESSPSTFAGGSGGDGGGGKGGKPAIHASDKTVAGMSGTTNTGGGGGGGQMSGQCGSGGSGIVVIRNHR